MRLVLSGLLLLSALAQATGEGAWQASSMGATISQRGMLVASAPLAPGESVKGVMTLVAWRYKLTAPAPADLVVRLCGLHRCVVLDGQSGTSQGFTNLPADEPLRFVWELPGRGSLFPVIQVLSNQVIVNYR